MKVNNNKSISTEKGGNRYMKNSPSKRFLSLLLCLVMFLSLMPAAAMAEDPAGDEQSL